MNKRIIACIAAAAVLCGVMPAAPAFVSGQFTADAAEKNISDVVNIPQVGEVYEVSVSNTSETPQWFSDDKSIAEVIPTSDRSAHIIAVGVGTTYVYAVLSNQTITFEVNVLAGEDNTPVSKVIGDITLNNAQNVVQAKLSNITNDMAEWSSTDESVATVDADGIITAQGKGKCEIRAVYKNYIYIINITSEYEKTQSGETEEEYKDSFIGSNITLTNTNSAYKINVTVPEGTVIEWSSTDESVAKVSDDGTVSAVGEGTCRIYAVIGKTRYYTDVTSTYTGISTGDTVDIGSIELNDEAKSRKVELKGVPEGAEIVWSSADESIASVDQEGIVTAVSSGKTVVTALINSIKYTITVNVSISERPSLGSDTEIKGIGNTMELSATGFSETPEWISMNKDVATVDENGVVTAVGYGEAVIVANSSTYSAKITIKVVPGYLPGDADIDGKVSVTDIVTVLQYSANKEKYPLTEQGFENAEVTGDGDVNANDAFYIQQYDAHLIETLPVIPKI